LFFQKFRKGVANSNRSLGRIGKKLPIYQLFGPHFDKREGNDPKYRKITDFQSKKFLIGPRVGHPCLKFYVYRLKNYTNL
jgi:hypothetical protein